MGILRDVCVKHSTYLVPSDVAAAKGRWRLHCSFPDKYAVLIVRCVIARVSCWDAISKACDAASIQLAGRSQRNDNVLNALVRTSDRYGDRGDDCIHRRGMGVANEFEVVPAGDPVAGTDVEVTLHAGRTYAEVFSACGGATAK